MSNIAFHYTNLNALYEIITSKSFLLTSLNNMNDTQEGSYTPTQFLSDFERIDYPEDDADNTKKFFKLLLQKIAENKNQFFELCKTQSQCFCTSFSTKSESLSHWERYADNMQGVCISFDLNLIENLNHPIFHDLYIDKIFYTDKMRAQHIGRQLVTMYNEFAKRLQTKNTEEIVEILTKNVSSHFAALYLRILNFVKNDYWREEGEVRLLYDEQTYDDNSRLIDLINFDSTKLKGEYLENHKNLGLDKIEFNLFSSIRPCKRLSLESVWNSDLIPEIKIRTKSCQNKKDLEMFLRANGLDKTDVTESRIKIR